MWSWEIAYKGTPPRHTPLQQAKRNLRPVSAQQQASTPSHPDFCKTPHRAFLGRKIFRPEQESNTATSSHSLWPECSPAGRDAPKQSTGRRRADSRRLGRENRI